MSNRLEEWIDNTFFSRVSESDKIVRIYKDGEIYTKDDDKLSSFVPHICKYVFNHGMIREEFDYIKWSGDTDKNKYEITIRYPSLNIVEAYVSDSLKEYNEILEEILVFSSNDIELRNNEELIDRKIRLYESNIKLLEELISSADNLKEYYAKKTNEFSNLKNTNLQIKSKNVPSHTRRLIFFDSDLGDLEYMKSEGWFGWAER